jgi:predicted dehydrogenase
MSTEAEGRVIRWGIVGCGDVTEVKSGPAFRKVRGSKLVAVMRRDGALARQYAKRHGVARWYDDVDALLGDAEVDAVYVATPVGSHAEIARKVADAGKPAYVEKPMARHAPECEDMVDTFARAGRRKLPRFMQVAALLAGGAVGKVTGVRYHYGSASHRKPTTPLPWRLDSPQSGGGLFLDLGCHALDIIDFLLGPLHEIHGMARNVASDHDVEDTVAMTFSVGEGVPGVASWNFAQQKREDGLEIAGTEGHVRLSVFGDTPIYVARGESVETIEVANPEHIQQPLVQSLVDALLGRGECPSTGETALRTSVVMDTVLSGYYGGREDRFWERAETWPGRRK